MCSIMREKPGPEVTVKALAPPQTAPWMVMEAANSSSIWMKMPPTVGIRAAKRSTTSVEGVIGYPAENRAPAARVPSQQAWSPSRKCAPVRTPFGSACMAGSVNCEVRAIQATQVATAAFLSGYDVRWVISLGIERRGERQHVSGAKLDAEAAALAALDGDVDGTFGHSGEGVHADGHTELGSDAMPCSARAAQPSWQTPENATFRQACACAD